MSPTLYRPVCCHYKGAVPVSKSMNLGPARVAVRETRPQLKAGPALTNVRLVLHLEPTCSGRRSQSDTLARASASSLPEAPVTVETGGQVR